MRLPDKSPLEKERVVVVAFIFVDEGVKEFFFCLGSYELSIGWSEEVDPAVIPLGEVVAEGVI